MWKKVIFFLSTCCVFCIVDSAVLNYTLLPLGNAKIISIDPITQANEVITIAGQGSTFADFGVLTLPFYDNFSLQYVPTSLFKTFPNLQEFDLVNCGTTTLVADAFSNCNNLEIIVVERGNIPNVPAGIASTCSAVIGLSLANNSISTIDVNAFQGLTNLMNLRLDYNQITCIPPTLFTNLNSINQITLSGNLITAIDSKILSGLPNLYIFDLSLNLLTYLPLLDLTGNTYFSSIYGFNDNPIKAINSKFTTIFTTRTTVSDQFYFDGISCLPAGTTSFSIESSDYTTTSSTLSTCFSNYIPATMPETSPCPPVTTTTVKPSATTIQDLICVTYPEWKEILKNFHLPQWKKRCPRFHRKKVCLHICFFIPGGDGDNDRDDRHTNVPGHTHKPDHPNTIPPVFHHRPGYPHVHKPGLHNPGPLSHIRPLKKPHKG